MRTPKHPAIAAFIGTVGLMASSVAWAQSDALLRCPRLADRDARLACYDAILPPSAASTAAPTAAPTSTPAAPRAATTPAASAPAPSPVAVAVATPADSAQAFGLANRARTGEPQSIDSEVVAGFAGWGPNERIRLVNKQVWRVDDLSSGTIDPSKRKVTVRRGLLGSFFLEFEGLTKSPRVSRVE